MWLLILLCAWIVFCAIIGALIGYWLGDRKANARLISAAPDLYECLQEAVKDYDESDNGYSFANPDAPDPIAKWRAALSKALGKEENQNG